VSSAPETQLVSLSLDYLDPAAVSVEPSAGLVSPLIAHCLAVIAAAVPHPGDTRLVISGDFVSSVKDRLAPGPYRDSYSTDRNDGSVGGKTLRLADGTIDIVMPSVVFEAADDEETNGFRAVLAIRTVTHEAQHVAMYQAEEAETDTYDEQPWARQNFLHAADQVIDEYRAETAIEPNLRGALGVWNPVDILERLRSDLSQIALVDYQAHLDVGRLSYDVGQQTHTAWKLLGYVAASMRHEDGAFDALAPEVETARTWQDMASVHWPLFLDVLSTVPPGSERIGRETLQPAVHALATLFQDWLRDLGFDWRDTATGCEFRIVRWDLLEQPQG
jgi:hypothetical protein